jgi:hypothetical protein
MADVSKTSAGKSVFVVAHYVVRATSIEHGQGRAVQCDFIELVCQAPLTQCAADTLQPLSNSLSDRLCLGLPGQFC